MEDTVVIAAMGFIATLLAAWMAGRSQRRGDREGRILDAKVRVYGQCSDSLYEYARATFNRVKARLDDRPENERQDLRQQAYRANTRARSVIGQVAILRGDEALRERLEEARRSVGDLNRAKDAADLKRRHDDVYQTLDDALGLARSDLSRKTHLPRSGMLP